VDPGQHEVREGDRRGVGAGTSQRLAVPISTTRIAAEADSPKLGAEGTTKFRRCVGITRFMRNFRGDIIIVVKELSHRLAPPTHADWTRFEKSARYLTGSEGIGVWLPKAGGTDVLVGYGDSDWANDKITRKSVSSGVLMIGGCILADYARSQSAPARASEGLHLKHVMELLLIKTIRLELMTDSTSA